MLGLLGMRYEPNPFNHLIEVRHLHQRRSLLPLGYSITGSAKGVDVKAFKIAAFRASMRRQYTSRTLQVEWPLGVTSCKALKEYMFSELPHIADVVGQQRRDYAGSHFDV
jgi:hypothetical protein